MSWRDMSLGELIDIKHGFAFKSAHFSDSGKYVLLSPGNCYEQGGLKLKGDKEKYYVGEIPQEYLLNRDDLLIVMTDLVNTAPILGGSFIIPEDDKYLHNQRLGLVQIIDDTRIHKKFLYYLLNTNAYRGQVRGSASGATVRHTSPERIKFCKVRIPDELHEQDCIASILSAYDDLIENNRRRIQLLEQSARLLYKEWFVHLRFPGHEHVKIKDGVPEGWEKRKLSELTTVVTKGTTPTTVGQSFVDEGINFIKVECIDSSGRILEDKLAKIDPQTHDLLKRSQLREGDILFSIAGAIGRSTTVPKWILPANTNQALAILRPRDSLTGNYLYSAVRAPGFIAYSSGRVVQTAQANVSLGALSAGSIVVPTEGLMRAFGNVTIPIRQQIENLDAQIRSAISARDLLLPRLMNGDLSA